ncbi:MAG: alpha/beta fold hydrolase [Polyangiaceae bacterium]
MTSRIEGTLPRRGQLGFAVRPGEHAEIGRVAAGSPAAEGGLRPGDHAVSLNGEAIPDAAWLRRAVQAIHVGAEVTLGISRDGVAMELTLRVGARPLEAHAGCETVYFDVPCAEYRLRAIATTPANARDRALPWILYVQGHGAASVDAGLEVERPLPALVGALTRAGWGVVRFERSGVGDSEGPAPALLSLAEEIAQVRAVHRRARALHGFDPAAGVLLGHSLGGVAACAIASDEAERPAGLVLYGGGVKLWTEYFDACARKQWTLAGTRIVDQDRALRLIQRFHAMLIYEGLSLAEIRSRMPEIDAEAELLGIGGADHAPGLHEVVRGRPASYWREMNEARVATQLTSANLPVLAAWGASDWLSMREDHELIAACVNEGAPGKGAFIEIPRADHHFAERATDAESYAARDRGSLAEAIPATLVAWLRSETPSTRG